MPENQELVNKYGEPLRYDHNFRGPMSRSRSCTDLPCLLIFLCFLGGWGFIGYYSVQHGDLNKLMIPTDSFNRKCGIDSQVLNKKYLFFFNLEKCIDPFVPLTGCDTPQVCVESCPTETFVWENMKNNRNVEELKSLLICISDDIKNKIKYKDDIEREIRAERCANRYIKSEPILNRCMWKFSKDMCDYIPAIFERGRRATTYKEHRNYTQQKMLPYSEPELQALALTMPLEQQQNLNKQGLQSAEEPETQCRRRTQLGETVIKEKMRQTNTFLSKMVGNLVAHFYKDANHDAQQIGEEIVEDILMSWQIVLIALVCTLFASLIFIALMRWLAKPIVWLSILGVIVGLGVGMYFSIRQYNFWRNTPTVPNHSYNINSAVKNIFEEANTWLYLSILIGICLFIILMLVIILRKRIRIAVALIKEGSKAVSSVWSTVFFPIFSWILIIASIAFAIAVGLYLGSIGEPYFRMIRHLDESSATGVTKENCICEGPAQSYKVGDQCNPTYFDQHCSISTSGLFRQSQRTPCIDTSCSFVKIAHSPTVNWFIAYNVFGFFWIIFFIAAFSDMVLASTFATWYWTFKKKDVPYFTLTRAFCQTIFYHLGTLAFGSLILAICRIIRIMLEYIDSKVKKYDNAVTRAILCMMKFFFWLLETFLRFLNRNAYIMCAMHGKGFCTSAKDAFNLIMRNFLRVVTLDKVTDFLFFLSKVLLTGAAGVATYYFLVRNPTIIQLHHNAVPVSIVVIAAFLITSVFFGVYSMAVDTLFLCFLEDCERNDGSSEKPYFMSKQLMKILGKRNKLPKRINNNQNLI